MNLFLQLFINGLASGCVYVLLSLSFGLAFYCLRVFHVALGGIYIASGLLLYSFCKSGIPAWIAVIMVTCTAGGLACAVEASVYYPMVQRKAKDYTVLIVSLGMFVVFENGLVLVYGNETKMLISNLMPAIQIGSITISLLQAVEIGIAGVIVFFTICTLRFSHFFRLMWALGDDPELLSIYGHNVRVLRLGVMFLSGALTGLGAGLFSLEVGIDPHIGMHYFLIAVVSVILGGTGRLQGWVLGALLLGILQSLTVWKLSVRWMDVMTFVVLVGVLTYRSQGLIDVKQRAEEAPSA